MQGKRLCIAALSGFAALSLSVPAFAIISVPAGWYIEGNVGSARLTNTNYGRGTSSTTSGVGGNINLGYKFMPFFGAEMGYSQYPNTNITTSSGNHKAGTAKIYSYDLAGKGIVPIIDSGFELFAKLGVQRINAHITTTNEGAAHDVGLSNGHHSSTGLYYGAGGQYYFFPELAVVVQWQSAQGSDRTGTESLFSIGLSFIVD